MKRYCLILMVATVAATWSLAWDDSKIQIANANSKLTSTFYDALRSGDGNKDVLFSPLGIHTVLSMLYQGANGTTKEALGTSLHVLDPETTAEGYSQILNRLNNIPFVNLHIANKAYVKQEFELVPEYENIIRNNFQTELEGIDFEENRGKVAASTINSWVNKTTKGKINQLFSAEDFNVYTRLVLVNAIYFKGTWKNPFLKAHTRTEPFYVDNNEEINVQMMHQIQDGLRYKQDFDIMAQVLELPFSSESVTLTIALPMEMNGIKNLEEKIAESGLDSISQNMFAADNIDIRIPKFKIESKMDLKGPLTKLGLGIIFDEKNSNFQNLAKLIPGENLYVTNAIQKALIEVNEEGAQASAATGAVAGVAYSAPARREQFYANHPFLVILRADNNILFYGKVMRPVSREGAATPTEESSSGTNRGEYGGERPPLHNPLTPSDDYNGLNQVQGPAQDRSWKPVYRYEPSDPYYTGNQQQTTDVPDVSTWYPKAGSHIVYEEQTSNGSTWHPPKHDKYDRISW